MIFRKSLVWAMAVGAMLLATSAQADQVQYITSGLFDGGTSPNSTTFTTADGISIAFTSSGLQTADITNGPSLATFGTFDTSATTNTTSNTPISSNFTLSVFQVSPGSGSSVDFLGALSGTLFVSNSQAYIQFAQPLTQTIGAIFYQIVSADDMVAGRVNLSPPSLNGGISTIAGRVGAVPEPSTLVLMGIGAPTLVAIRYRRKRNANVAV